ncbi:hypothetical protein LTR37_008611 [Vermiconidia calcicola]|uniref:Uncharacterized protein n=1 Tax=Vermiconidia calcicola TaxID=1690605 RepID=A0ACC3NAP0_9PEZI|nr:hypothetical protein LTR37_008611 [Vermiconidia calcicola]
MVADYLQELHKQFELNKLHGGGSRETTPLPCILTLPTVWLDGTENATLNAAKQAGMGPDITLISEPEAAAVYTL